MSTEQIVVEYVPGNNAWCVLGGGLPNGACWSQHDTEAEAEQEADELREDLGLS